MYRSLYSVLLATLIVLMGWSLHTLIVLMGWSLHASAASTTEHDYFAVGSDGDLTISNTSVEQIYAPTSLSRKTLRIENTGATNPITGSVAHPATATNGRFVLSPYQSITLTGIEAGKPYYFYSTSGSTMSWAATYGP